MAAKPSGWQAFKKNWWAVEAAPIFVIVGGISIVAGAYAYRLATGPTIQWTHSNPTPWNNIQPDMGTKMLEVNHKFDKKWSRE
ncbi:hypothetical protein CYLTODRAFT_486159 [Cylindrobasidium torrendii FP15055 ss-10]|uniref:Uncharacterized protein n=1 Tax=Cylindrobasidium torrendii FP15055 ss-10 TaxID=1314674 RepID=A0A0D7BQK5_9AGAR|nr:hypothetical protein CYLTODRAFT_486159 [Cylindrobasidium torrendii FP15055 ss-10]